MIIEQTRQPVVVAGERMDSRQYSIDPSAVGHITHMLRNMYSHPEEAVIREYCANAVDAHVLNGMPERPIDVHLPTICEPWLLIRDYGGGLDIEDTKALLYSYGTSGGGKRDTNTAIGGFGIGCKSGFAVSDQFLYTVWFGGRKRVWNCYLDENDEGRADLLTDDEDAGEPGIEVKIPVTDVVKYRTAARQCFRYWHPPVTFTGKKIDLDDLKPIVLAKAEFKMSIDGREHVFSISGEVPSADSYSFDRKWAPLMGGFKYSSSSDSSLTDQQSSLGRLEHVIEIPAGLLPLAPTRESIRWSPRAAKIWKALVEKACSPELGEALLADAKQRAEAMRVRVRASILGQAPHCSDALKRVYGTGTHIQPRQPHYLISLKLFIDSYTKTCRWEKRCVHTLNEKEPHQIHFQKGIPEVVFDISGMSDADLTILKQMHLLEGPSRSAAAVAMALRFAGLRDRAREAASNAAGSVTLLATTGPLDKHPGIEDGSIMVVPYHGEAVKYSYASRHGRSRAGSQMRYGPKPHHEQYKSKAFRYRKGGERAGSHWEPCVLDKNSEGPFIALDKFLPAEKIMGEGRMYTNSSLASMAELDEHLLAKFRVGLTAVRVADVRKMERHPGMLPLRDWMKNTWREEEKKRSVSRDGLAWAILDRWLCAPPGGPVCHPFCDSSTPAVEGSKKLKDILVRIGSARNGLGRDAKHAVKLAKLTTYRDEDWAGLVWYVVCGLKGGEARLRELAAVMNQWMGVKTYKIDLLYRRLIESAVDSNFCNTGQATNRCGIERTILRLIKYTPEYLFGLNAPVLYSNTVAYDQLTALSRASAKLAAGDPLVLKHVLALIKSEETKQKEEN